MAGHLWFVAAVFRLHAAVSSSSAAAAAAAASNTSKDLPACCCRFLGLVQRLLSHGFGGHLDVALFYRAVEDTVTDGRDLAKPLVHRAVFAVAEHVGVGPEAFLAYLEGRKLAPASELLAMVRTRTCTLHAYALLGRILSFRVAHGLSPGAPRPVCVCVCVCACACVIR